MVFKLREMSQGLSNLTSEKCLREVLRFEVLNSLCFENLENTIAQARLGVLHRFQAERNVSWI